MGEFGFIVIMGVSILILIVPWDHILRRWKDKKDK